MKDFYTQQSLVQFSKNHSQVLSTADFFKGELIESLSLLILPMSI